MPDSPASRLLRKDLVEVSDPPFLVEREKYVDGGCTDFASSIDHSGGDWALYPSFYLRESRGALADFWNAQFGTGLSADQILLTRGSSEGIDLCLRASDAVDITLTPVALLLAFEPARDVWVEEGAERKMPYWGLVFGLGGRWTVPLKGLSRRD